MIAAWGVAGLLLVSLLYYLFSVWAARRFFRPTAWDDAEPETLPPVSILKPLKGVQPDLYDNLASFCRLDYPVFQLVCGVREADDPAVGIVRRLQRDFPDRDVRLVVAPKPLGSNDKVGTLHRLMSAVEYDHLVVTDSDVSVRPEYLRSVIPALASAGVASCVYRGGARRPLPALIESLMINATFMSQVVVASRIETPRYAFGASMALTRACLDAIGGFAALRDYLADDYRLGLFASRAGYGVRVLPTLVETRPDAGSLRDLFHHQLRWARTQRNCRPAGYVGTVVTFGTVWAGLGLLGWWGAPEFRSVGILSLVVLGVRMATAAVLSHWFLRSPLPKASLLLVPLTDLFSFAIWCASLVGNTVRWREYRFRVQKDGRMVRVSEPRRESRAGRHS